MNRDQVLYDVSGKPDPLFYVLNESEAMAEEFDQNKKLPAEFYRPPHRFCFL